MIKVPLKIPGGGLLTIHGPWPARRLLLILSREDFARDSSLTTRVTCHFCNSGLTVVRYETERMVIRRALQHSRLATLPKPLRRLAKAAYLLSSPNRWRFFSKSKRTDTSTLAQRIISCRALIDLLNTGPDIFLWGRSAGGLLASLVADGTAVKKIIIMGHPFQKPNHPDEPARYAHLATLQKPCLILQGIHDPYGGADITRHYRFAPATRIKLVDTDHNFQLSEEKWDDVLGTMHAFLDEPVVLFPTGDFQNSL